ncbi:hypothetical protein SDC9_132714 [bioreactor metagenome]|uniref:Uncharacterized protein n=1 Tax=bioreactor metagenome TaxID=1076179 RepID=A0A645D9N0_9ZZZZ
MRSQDHVVHVQHLAAVLAERFGLIYVQARAKQNAGLQSLDHLFFTDQAAAGHIQKNGAGLHHLELFHTHGMLCGGHQRQVNGDEIGGLPNFIGTVFQLDGQASQLLLRHIGVIADNLHAQAVDALGGKQLGNSAAAH